MVKIDLGCGATKKKGFFGIDNYDKTVYDGKKIVSDMNHDLNLGIPFVDNVVSEVWCSHSLEHFNNPYFILSEIYRVCKPDSLVTIIVPLKNFEKVHVTVFYEDWFEKTGVLKNRFEVVDKKIVKDKNFTTKQSPVPIINDELTIKLKVMK